MRRRQIRVSMTDAQRRRGRISLAGKTIKLGPRSTEIVAFLLMSSPDVWVSYDDLIGMIWSNPDEEIEAPLKTLHVLLHQLRKKHHIPILVRYGGQFRIPRERRDYDDLHFCQDRSNCKSLYGGLCKRCELIRRGAEPRILPKRKALLEFIRDNPGSSHQKMAEALGRKQPRIHQSLIRMEELGLVKSRSGKYRSTELTQKGLDLLEGRLPRRRRNTVNQRVTIEGKVLGMTRGIPQPRRAQ